MSPASRTLSPATAINGHKEAVLVSFDERAAFRRRRALLTQLLAFRDTVSAPPNIERETGDHDECAATAKMPDDRVRAATDDVPAAFALERCTTGSKKRLTAGRMPSARLACAIATRKSKMAYADVQGGRSQSYDSDAGLKRSSRLPRADQPPSIPETRLRGDGPCNHAPLAERPTRTTKRNRAPGSRRRSPDPWATRPSAS